MGQGQVSAPAVRGMRGARGDDVLCAQDIVAEGGLAALACLAAGSITMRERTARLALPVSHVVTVAAHARR